MIFWEETVEKIAGAFEGNLDILLIKRFYLTGIND